ncbi:hypothetical protein BGX28_002891 [Mortierella sp. GBA30]|nr:hypothetical protein BGX28_002891 [Mortierella sp. GBA30]
MIYHALRLACIIISSFKTWAAVVDAEDRSQARRHMVLWLLTLAGLAIEPIIDAIFSYRYLPSSGFRVCVPSFLVPEYSHYTALNRLPMYESSKIVLTGWILLAHFYLSKAPMEHEDEDEDDDLDSTLLDELTHAEEETGTRLEPNSRNVSSASLDQVSRTRRHIRPEQSLGASTINTLDFGRFKRDLERRHSVSKSSIMESEIISPSLMSWNRSRFDHKDGSPAVSTPPMQNPFRVSPTTHSEPRRASTWTTTIPTTPFSFDERLPKGYEFGSEPPNRKRLLRTVSQTTRPTTPSARSLSKQDPITPRTTTRRQYSGTRSPLSFEPESDDLLTARKIKRTRSSGGAGELTTSKPIRHTFEIDGRGKAAQSGRASFKDEDRYRQPANVPASASRQLASFSRPKPPGKNRTRILSEPKSSSFTTKAQQQPSSNRLDNDRPKPAREYKTQTSINTLAYFEEKNKVLHEQPGDVGSASLESRMRHVRDWIKERNPSIISPSLIETSRTYSDRRSLSRRETVSGVEAEGSFQQRSKRKAHRQLAPNSSPKRLAPESTLETRSQRLRNNVDRTLFTPRRGDQDATAQRSQSFDATPASMSDLSPVVHSNSVRSPPLARISSNLATEVVDPLREQNLLTAPVDWSRFQRPRRISRSKSLTSPTVYGQERHPSTTSSFLIRRTPKKVNGRMSIGTYGGNDHDGEDSSNTAISPLIKLRQSQLKQRQKEDFLGIKHSDGPAMTRREREEEGTFRFNDALDAWEKEDDETLALNAAREAAEVEARGQKLSQQRQRDIQSPLSAFEGEEKETEKVKKENTGRDSVLSSSFFKKGAPTASLLRTIPFNGESSRRPVPDLKAVKSKSSLLQDNASLNDDHRIKIEFGGAVSLANKRRNNNISPEEVAVRRERHPGLYTPSKKTKNPNGDRYNKSDDLIFRNLGQKSPHKSTPTSMSRYIQLSGLTDEDDSS